MYHPHLVAIRRAQLERTLNISLQETPPAEIPEWTQRLSTVFHPKTGERVRALTPEEDRFVLHERLLGKIDWRYWAERYCVINLAGQTLGPLFPLMESQVLILDAIGRQEKDRYESGHPDGLFPTVLKARQLGASTVADSIIAHRTTTHANVFALVASDVPDNSSFLYDMFERTVDHLAWWMKPTITERVKNDEMVFGTGSRLFVAASKSTRGADKTTRGSQDGKKGQLGRGKTISNFHLSELATWTNPGQINASFMPAVPQSPFSFGMFESTAQGWGPTNWWYQTWQIAKAGKGRLFAVFIPWYAEASKYWLPAPADWSPNETTHAHALRAAEYGPRWMHRTVRLTREQLYWYETNRNEAEAHDRLEEFLQEYPADDEEAFQLSGHSIFPTKMRERVKTQMRPIAGIVEIRSNRELGLVR